MRVIFVYFGPLDVNSAIQAFHFGTELSDRGWDVTLAGIGDPSRINAIGEPNFECTNHEGLLAQIDEMEVDRERTIVCAWTPREPVRQVTERIVSKLRVPYTIHLEDNERYLLESSAKMTLPELQRLPLAAQDRIAPPTLIHPTHHVEFLRGAAGVTVITEELNEFNVGGRPHHVARPGIDTERFDPERSSTVTRESLGLRPEDFLLVYHGTIHYANQHEMMSLYTAVKLLQRRGRRVKLVRLGHSEFGGADPRAFRALSDGVLEMGPVSWRQMPDYLAIADAYVQPGAPDEFNRYRLPSKLPEFLAMGRPVVLPDCNIGHDLVHGENALLMKEGNAVEIMSCVEQLIDDRELAARLGRGARKFALEQLSWPDNSAALGAFYTELISAHTESLAA
ncbi:MAG TPA: glycosyltransferase [Solirubrobacterales bacterium]|jgi:glycosyltransferase involved in cell wall biosynthesis|nr:glycosyltransferase [Solirubrobacterales bacterium]